MLDRSAPYSTKTNKTTRQVTLHQDGKVFDYLGQPVAAPLAAKAARVYKSRAAALAAITKSRNLSSDSHEVDDVDDGFVIVEK